MKKNLSIVMLAVAMTVAVLAFPGNFASATPNWDGALCETQFEGQFINIGSVKVYNTYALIAGKKTTDFDIYVSVLEGGNWSTPEPVTGTNTASNEVDVTVAGEKIYIIRGSKIFTCDWDDAMLTATDCSYQTETFGSDPNNFNARPPYMYCSGGMAGAVSRIDMNTWIEEAISPVNWDSFGVDVLTDYAIIAVECDLYFGDPPYDCYEKSRMFRYDFPSWTGVTDLSEQLDLGLNIMASPYVDSEGTLWFVGGSSWGALHAYKCPSTCTPNCAGAECGDDGCGGSCGTCAGSETCEMGICACTPNCAGKECGTDGCVGSCGTCPDFYACYNGKCECVPDCTGKECGDDGCGTPCGECSGSDTCVAGVCECTPFCTGKECGDDGCGGSCGTCSDSKTCVDGVCSCMLLTPPHIQLGPECEVSGWTCGDSAQDAISFSNKSGQTCQIEMEVRSEAQGDTDPLPAQIFIYDYNGTPGTFACEWDACVIVYGQVTVDDHGEHVTAIPSGETVDTGVVGTSYSVFRYTELGDDIFEATCSAGEIWYVFHFPGGDYEVHLGTCETCQNSTKVDLTDGEVVLPVEPSPEVVEGESDVVEQDLDVVSEVVEDIGGEDLPADTSVDTSQDTPDPDSGEDTNSGDTPPTPDSSPDVGGDSSQDVGSPELGEDSSDISETDTSEPPHKKGGGCSCSTGSSPINWDGVVLLAILLAGVYFLKKKRA